MAQIETSGIELSDSNERSIEQEVPHRNGQSNEKADATTENRQGPREDGKKYERKEPTTLKSLLNDRYTWAQETFPTTMTVFHHLPLPLLPFAFCMFVLVQALVTKGWVPVFAHGWDHWVEKTGTVGAVGGMGFVAVILCNVSLLCPRIIQIIG